MSEEFEIESFEDLLDVFENTGDFGKYYLGDYSNIQIANYLRKMQQENKQLKETIKEATRILNSAKNHYGNDGKNWALERVINLLGDKE